MIHLCIYIIYVYTQSMYVFDTEHMKNKFNIKDIVSSSSKLHTGQTNERPMGNNEFENW